MSGFFITGVINRQTTAHSLMEGEDAAKPNEGNVDGDLFLAYDTLILYRFDSNTGWVITLVGSSAVPSLQQVTTVGKTTNLNIATAGIAQPIIRVATNHNGTAQNFTILVDTTAASINVTLDASTIDGAIYVVKLVNGGNPVIIGLNGPGKIDNQTNFILTKTMESVMMQISGNQAWVLAKYL